MKKIIKIVGISVLILLVAGYLAFLFVLPYAVDLNKYEPQIEKAVQDNTGLNVDLEGLKIKSAWNSVGALIKKADFKYPEGEKFAQINNLEVDLSLWNLFLGKIKVNKVSADKVLANIEMNEKWKMENGKFPFTLHSSRFTFGNSLNIKTYRISFINGPDKYSIKGSDLKISDFILNEKIKIKTKGQLILKERKQISYDFSVLSEVFPEAKKHKTDIITVLEDLYKYNINADIKADLAVKKENINGFLNIDKLFFTVGNKTYPQSSLKLNFKGDKANINSSLHVDNKSKAIVSGILKTGKDKFVDLQVKSDEINIKDILLITKAMSKTLGLEKFKNINANGLLKADFSIKSDFKKVKSNGYLKIKDAIIFNNKLSLSSLNADVDFSQSFVQINNAKAKLNGQPINIKGNIDKNANANISVSADNLQLKSVLSALGKQDILNQNDISGLVTLKASLVGHLDKTTPKINIILDNINLKNKLNKIQVKLTKITVNSGKNINTGTAQISEIKIYPDNMNIIAIPKINLNFDDKNLSIQKTFLYVNDIKTELTGIVSNINSTPKLNNVSISIPNQISVPLKGYQGSNAILKGTVTLNGDINNPQISGEIDIPAVSIPSVSTYIKNFTIRFGEKIIVNCPHLQAVTSQAAFDAQIDKGFSKGIVVKNVNFNAKNIDLNYLIPIYKKLGQSSPINLTIINGKSTVQNFRTGGLVSNNISSDIALKKNVLELGNLHADAYLGKIAGDIKYDLQNSKIFLKLQGRGLSTNQTLTGLSGRDDDINGKLDFDGDVSMKGFSGKELILSLRGYNNFLISNGQMGMLGQLEHLIYAQNIVSNNVFRATLNVIAKAVSAKDTGVYKYIKGKMTFSNGRANIEWIKTAGPSMSLYITGRYYIPDNTASLIMLGRISDDVVSVLGPIGEFSMDKAVSSIPTFGDVTVHIINQFTTSPVYENTSEIPELTLKTDFKTKEFKVVIDGDIRKQTSVKSFKWLSRPKVNQINHEQYSPPQKQLPDTPEFVKKLPDFKE
ncbi:MAG: AsmA-like C-terminal region-containing protein [Candidatus Gastranaerophilales bacterium]|nr:AsmA-like C-terminal region-containing protein [Candidatus Gastranaerophilales bacterium]